MLTIDKNKKIMILCFGQPCENPLSTGADDQLLLTLL